MTSPIHECPDFCAMHTDSGAHVAEFDGPGELEGGWHVYYRQRMEPNGTFASEVAVVQNNGAITRTVVPYKIVPFDFSLNR